MRKHSNSIFLAAMISVFIWASVSRAAEIVIGYSGPLSGLAVEFGQDCLNGIDMAIKEINASGGINIKNQNYTFRLVSMDDQFNPKIAVNNVRQLRKEHKALAVFNAGDSIAAIMKINQEKGNEILLMAYTGLPTITDMNNKLMVVIPPSFSLYCRFYTDLAWEKGWRKAAMVVTAGNIGDEWRSYFSKEWVKKGGIITADKSTNYYTRTDFTKPLTEALATNPDFLLIGGPSATTALVIEQARARGFEGGFVLLDIAKMDAIRTVLEKPLLMEGSIGVKMFSDVPDCPASITFLQNSKTNYLRTPTWENALHYTGMYALARAVAEARTADNVHAIRAAFPRVFPMLGDRYPIEIYGISPHGRFIYPLSIQSMRHGKFTKPDYYVWWTKSKKEFDMIQKQTKNSTPLTWKRVD